MIEGAGKGELIVDGTISGIKIEAQTITGGLLATAGIITNSAQIDNLVVTRAKIADLAINAAKIADLAVSNAKIANLAVDGAKIANLAVDTLKVADNAVTFTTVVEPADVGAAGLSGSYVTIGTLTLNLAYPAGVVFGCGCQMVNASTASGALNVRTRLAGADVRGSHDTCDPSIRSPAYSMFTSAINLPAGTHTISLQAQANGSTAGKSVLNMFLFALRAYK